MIAAHSEKDLTSQLDNCRSFLMSFQALQCTILTTKVQMKHSKFKTKRTITQVNWPQ